MGKGVINLSLWDLLKGYGRIPKAGEPLMSSNCCGLHLSSRHLLYKGQVKF